MSERNKPAATMADIARVAGVSVSTVSRALSGSSLVASAKVEEILRVARDAGYVVNATARNLRLKRTQTIGVVIPLGHEASQPLTDPFLSQMIIHLADEITVRGYGMFLQKVLAVGKDWLQQLLSGPNSSSPTACRPRPLTSPGRANTMAIGLGPGPQIHPLDQDICARLIKVTPDPNANGFVLPRGPQRFYPPSTLSADSAILAPPIPERHHVSCHDPLGWYFLILTPPFVAL